MDIQQLYEICLAKKGVTEHFPFDEDTLVFKVGGKMFCLASLQKWEQNNKSINVKCHPVKALELREQYQAVKPGYHMSKVHWNTITFNEDASDKEILQWLQESYDLVLLSLPKKLQIEINNL
jgi:predicted DNA-binding protein (MmcQ/YjbR family)